jgi:hypothetical protein
MDVLGRLDPPVSPVWVRLAIEVPVVDAPPGPAR